LDIWILDAGCATEIHSTVDPDPNQMHSSYSM